MPSRHSILVSRIKARRASAQAGSNVTFKG